MDKEEKRLELELEFVQCLANPAYLHFLAQQSYFDNARFISYLKYLQYWKYPPYLSLIEYPHCLVFLDLLQSKTFRTELAKNEFILFLHEQQYAFWKDGSKLEDSTGLVFHVSS